MNTVRIILIVVLLALLFIINGLVDEVKTNRIDVDERLSETLLSR